MGHIRNRMDSFLALHMVTPRKQGSRDIVVTQRIAKQATELWPTNVYTEIFREDLVEFWHRIKFLVARLHELHQYKRIVVHAQKSKAIDYDVLEWLWELHSEHHVSSNIENLFDMLWYGQSDKYDSYTEDFHVHGTRGEDYYNSDDNINYSAEAEEVDYDNYTAYPDIKPKSKKKKECRVDVYKLCLTDIKEEEMRLKVINDVRRDMNNYCLYTVCAVLNQKTSNDWGILSRILDFL